MKQIFYDHRSNKESLSTFWHSNIFILNKKDSQTIFQRFHWFDETMDHIWTVGLFLLRESGEIISLGYFAEFFFLWKLQPKNIINEVRLDTWQFADSLICIPKLVIHIIEGY